MSPKTHVFLDNFHPTSRQFLEPDLHCFLCNLTYPLKAQTKRCLSRKGQEPRIASAGHYSAFASWAIFDNLAKFFPGDPVKETFEMKERVEAAFSFPNCSGEFFRSR